MVNTRGKQKTASSSITPKASKTAENALAEGLTSHALTINMEEPNADGQYEDKVELPVEEAEHEGNEVPGEDESGEVAKVVNNAENITEINNDNKVESEPNSSEDDETDDQEDLMWDEEEELSEEDDEENVGDEDEASEEEAEKGDDEDEVSIEEASEKEGDKEDEVSRQKMAAEVAKGDERKPKAKEDEAKSKDGKEVKEHNNDKVEAGLKNDKNSNETRKKNVRVGISKKLDSKAKTDSSRKRKGKKRVESMGMIFMCSSKTKDDCYQYRVFGLPESKKDIVEKIYTGMRLFLYDVDLKLMYGIYKAAGPGGYNIEPKAFKSQFPAQVRFAVLDDCLPLPEEKFKKVIKENYFTNTKFDCQLKAQQVKKLCKLFIVSSKGRRSKKIRRSRTAENLPRPVHQDRGRRRRVGGDERRLALRDEEPRYHERPHKRPRKAIVSPPRHQPPPAPLPSAVPSYGYERTSDVDAYRRDQYPYRDRRNPPLVIRRDPYIDRLDRYAERDFPYRDPYVERHESYSDGREIYSRGRDPYVDGRASYIERRDAYRDGRDPNVGIRSSYRDGRDAYVERRDPYTYSEAYSIYRRDLLSDGRDAYREGEGGDYGISFWREEELHYPYGVETRNRHGNGSRDSYVSNSQRPSYADPIYTVEYPSRAGLAREYHL